MLQVSQRHYAIVGLITNLQVLSGAQTRKSQGRTLDFCSICLGFSTPRPVIFCLALYIYAFRVIHSKQQLFFWISLSDTFIFGAAVYFLGGWNLILK